MTKAIYATLLAVIFLCSGCFEVIEKIDLKDNGSGTFQFTLNMSKSKTKIASILKMKTINGRPVPTKTEITQKVKEIETILKASPGISNVTSQLDLNNFIATIKCSFDKVESLNRAARKIGEKQKAKPGEIKDNYAYQATSKIFSRLANFSLSAEYNKLSNADKEIFNGATYTGIIRFEKPITSVSNKKQIII
ncbi:hypothetical protein [Niabella ginsengisoli]|uniref:Lipoprotein n=1 Tax=Niabella ginsengisoli TaxID=522298 RepID=A0ABS9SF23_9BACT|nr:hypothetical protein [Niabella ginsengisoli]MCH5596945.1 hypothetical protein [Niabella ginsengisoli]